MSRYFTILHKNMAVFIQDNRMTGWGWSVQSPRLP